MSRIRSAIRYYKILSDYKKRSLLNYKPNSLDTKFSELGVPVEQKPCFCGAIDNTQKDKIYCVLYNSKNYICTRN